MEPSNESNEWARRALAALLKRLQRQAGEELLREAVAMTAAAARLLGRRA